MEDIKMTELVLAGVGVTSAPFVPIVSVMMTTLFSTCALMLVTIDPRRRSVEVDSAQLALAAATILLVGFLTFVLIYVGAPELRHFAHGGF
jgi:hypothetical protein